MATRASAKSKKGTSKKGGKVKSKGTVATLPKQSRAGKPGVGHNSGAKGGMTDSEKKVEINRLNRLYADWQKELETAKQSKGVYDAARKAAKKKGLNIDAYTDARDMHKDDHGHVQQHFADVGDILRIMESPLATQLDMFQGIEVPERPDDRPAGVRGLEAGRAGNDRQENPYPANSDEYTEYDNAWLEGQKEIATGERTIN